MITRPLRIEGIPAILWGPPSGDMLIAVHGGQSSKADAVIGIAAEAAVQKGIRLLSFDLPEHGERQGEPRRCDAQSSVRDLTDILRYARAHAERVSVFACSMGAYFAMLAYADAPIRQALFLSPVVDMRRLIESMMRWFNITPERLERERELPTPISTLYWDDYQYVLRHPVRWSKPTALLCGAGDALCEHEVVEAFAEGCGAELAVLEGSGHFFNTAQELGALRRWLDEKLV